MIRLTSDDVVLFQGDSITDGNRGRGDDPNHILGHGFACMVCSRLGADNLAAHPLFINRGQSGDGVAQLVARWRRDAILLKPTLLNVLIGVNDSGCYHAYDSEGNGMPVERFKMLYRMLLQDAREANGAVRIVLCEPFYVPLPPADEAQARKQRRVTQEVAGYAQATRELAEEMNAVFVPLQKLLAGAAASTMPGYVVWDGVHPTMVGHELITRRWFEAVEAAWGEGNEIRLTTDEICRLGGR